MWEGGSEGGGGAGGAYSAQYGAGGGGEALRAGFGAWFQHPGVLRVAVIDPGAWAI